MSPFDYKTKYQIGDQVHWMGRQYFAIRESKGLSPIQWAYWRLIKEECSREISRSRAVSASPELNEILLGIFKNNTTAAFFGTLGCILSSIYALWLYNRIVFGNIKSQYLINFLDLNKIEFFILTVLFILVILFGIIPSNILKFINLSLISNFIYIL